MSLLLSGKNSFYILDTSTSSDKLFVNIFSHSLGYLFPFLGVSFQVYTSPCFCSIQAVRICYRCVGKYWLPKLYRFLLARRKISKHFIMVFIFCNLAQPFSLPLFPAFLAARLHPMDLMPLLQESFHSFFCLEWSLPACLFSNNSPHASPSIVLSLGKFTISNVHAWIYLKEYAWDTPFLASSAKLDTLFSVFPRHSFVHLSQKALHIS